MDRQAKPSRCVSSWRSARGVAHWLRILALVVLCVPGAASLAQSIDLQSPKDGRTSGTADSQPQVMTYLSAQAPAGTQTDAETDAATRDTTVLLAVAVSAVVLVTGILGIVIVLMLRRKPVPPVQPVPVSLPTVVPTFEVPEDETPAVALAVDPASDANAGGRPEASFLDTGNVTNRASIPVEADFVILGRSKQNTEVGQQAVILPRRTVGRRHASVEYRAHAFYLVDQGSVNGTFLNGSRIEEPTVLHDGDVIRLESVDLTFSLPVEQASARTMMAPMAFAAEALTLKVELPAQFLQPPRLDPPPVPPPPPPVQRASGPVPRSGGLIEQMAADPRADEEPADLSEADVTFADYGSTEAGDFTDAGDGGLIAQMLERGDPPEPASNASGSVDFDPFGPDDSAPASPADASDDPGFTIAPEYEVSPGTGDATGGITIAPDFAVAAKKVAEQKRRESEAPVREPAPRSDPESAASARAASVNSASTHASRPAPQLVPAEPVVSESVVPEQIDVGPKGAEPQEIEPQEIEAQEVEPRVVVQTDAGPGTPVVPAADAAPAIDPRSEDTVPDYAPPPIPPTPRSSTTGSVRDPRLEDTIDDFMPPEDVSVVDLEPDEVAGLDPDIAAIFADEAAAHARATTAQRDDAAPVDQEDRIATADLSAPVPGDSAALRTPDDDSENITDTEGLLGMEAEPATPPPRSGLTAPPLAPPSGAAQSPTDAIGPTMETRRDDIQAALRESAERPRGESPPPLPAEANQGGQPRAWLNDLDSVTRTPRFEIQTPKIVVGRSAPNPERTGQRHDPTLDYLTIRRNTIGRRHAYVGYDEDCFYVEDYQSINGTYVNGERVVGRVNIRDADEVAFDEFRFRFEIEPPPPPPPRPPLPGPDDEDGATVMFRAEDVNKTQMMR
jgi:pSer/pThr/pTyr-binding forkhead associated (FHA) protein